MADTATIISRLGARFNNATESRDIPDPITRDIGGQFRNNQPYITGYFQVMFGLPEKLFGNQADASTKWLFTTVEGFTPHSVTLNKVDIMGQGQIGSSFPTSIMTTREFTTTHREYQNLPILNIIKRWASVFDVFTGVSPLAGKDFIPSNYKGWCAVLNTKPVRADGASLSVEDIEECYIYQGVFPTNHPVDTASSTDITGNDTTQHSITWSFDGSPLTSSEPGVTAKCISLVNGMNAMSGGQIGSSYEKFLTNIENINQWAAAPSDDTGGSRASFD